MIAMISRRLQKLIYLGLLFLLSAGCARNRDSQADGRTRFSTSSRSQPLTADGKKLLDILIDGAALPDLRWPNFSDYQSQIKEFYDSLDGTLPWIRHGKPTPQARAIIRSLKNAKYKGLRPEDYDGPRWDERLTQLAQSPTVAESDLVRFDLALTVCTVRYISDVHIGRVNPRQFHFDLDIDHAQFDLVEFLRQKLVSSNDVDATIETAEPPFPVYHRTETALKAYLELTREDDLGPLPIPSHTVKPGDSYSGAPLLARFLVVLGDLPAKPAYIGKRYQGVLIDGVRHFQQRHGLEANGWIDTPTIRELNIPLDRRVAQLELTMERLRWLPQEFDRPPIVVNIPEFRLHADNEEYRWVLSMKVVVGEAYHHQTPVFASEIRSVIFRPYWDVPSSILLAELIPHLQTDPSYLAENSYEIVDNNGLVVSGGTVSTAVEAQLRWHALRVRQKPGPGNALGLVKFNIPSSYDVYLHGTPATELFSKSRRDFSHGCIRVEDPLALAEWVLRDMPVWTEEKIRAAMNGDKTVQVSLDRPIPVLILYSTAVVMEDGEVHFFDDIYGLDASLERALDQCYPWSAGTGKPSRRQ